MLRVLANWRDEFHAVEGEVCYSPFSPDDIRLHHRGDVQYCPEDDVHFPTLTVEQTIRFAAKMRVPRARAQGLSRMEITDVLMTSFGLRHVRKTPVGDACITRSLRRGEEKSIYQRNFGHEGLIDLLGQVRLILSRSSFCLHYLSVRHEVWTRPLLLNMCMPCALQLTSPG